MARAPEAIWSGPYLVHWESEPLHLHDARMRHGQRQRPGSSPSAIWRVGNARHHSGWDCVRFSRTPLPSHSPANGVADHRRRYYFDMRIDDDLGKDEEGVDLANLDDVQKEALRVLAEMAWDLIEFPASMAVEVRDDDGPVMRARVA